MILLSARMARWTLMAVAAAAMIGAAASDPSAASAAPAPAVKTVSYRGYNFQVPAGWPVVRTGRTSTTCVNFDRHAIYLGDPGPDQRCPSDLLGTTEAILVQPSPASSAPSGSSAAEDPVARRISVVAPRIEVTATYDADRALLAQVLTSAGLPVPVASAAAANGLAGLRRSARQAPVPSAAQQVLAPAAAAANVAAGATSYLGHGFDACAAPSAAFMTAWKNSSPYGAVGVYIGGSERACAQPNLTAGWVSQQAAAGWHFLPIYVGVQAEFDQITSPSSQAVAAAQDAVTQAAALGFGPGTPIYYDMEAYPASQESNALAFLSAWTRELHAEGYKSGVYSSSSSGVTDLVANYAKDAMPDVIWDALWNGAANTADSAIPAADWANHQRAHQFNGGANETYGGDTINVDQDYLDVNLQPPGPAQQGQAALMTETGQVSDYVIRGKNLYAYYQRTPGGAFSGPKKLSSSNNLTGTPVAVQTANGAISVFAATTSGSIRGVVESAPGGAATKSIALSGHFTGGLAAIAAQKGTVAVYAVGTDRNLYTFYQTSPGGGFKGAKRLTASGNLTGVPAAVQIAKGVISVYTRTTGGGVKAVWQSAVGGAVTKAANLSGHLSSSPAAVITSTGAIAVYAVGRNGQLYGFEQRKPGGVFIGPAKLTVNGGLTGTPVALPGAAGTVSVYVRSKGGPVRARWQSAAYGAFSHGATLSGRRIVGDLGGQVAAGAVSLYGTGASGLQYADKAGAVVGSFSGWRAI
jgi:Rv2525c-like, glycoside hydrolase-like domain